MTDLTEEQARQMEAGEELDAICARFMGFTCENGFWVQPNGVMFASIPPRFSTNWSAAGPLLEVMSADLNTGPDGWRCIAVGGERFAEASGPTPQLAIARACAVLVARGVTREEVEGE
jgi:hypothetical protein